MTKPTQRSRPIAELHPHPRNPRRITDAQLRRLAASLEADPGMLEAHPVITLPDGTILGGHQRVRAASEILGWTKITCRVVDLDPERALQWVIRLNAPAGEWDDAPLAELLAEMSEWDAPLEGLGLADDHVSRLLDSITPALPDDPDDAPPPPDQPESQLGEVYELGEHRLICGDATEPAVLEQVLAGDLVDCVFTDPPYAIYGSSTGLSQSITDDKIVRPFFRDALAQAQRWSRMFAHVYVCCDWRSWPSWWEVAKLTGLAPKNLLVWDKGSSGMGSNWANTYELIGFFVHMPEQKTMSGKRRSGMRPVLSPNVIRANRPAGADREHNAAKPVDLIEHILGHATKPGELVLDLFGGSGSTMAAAERMGRRSVMVELDPRYCDVIRARYERLKGAVDVAA